jgi:hypothetical protein
VAVIRCEFFFLTSWTFSFWKRTDLYGVANYKQGCTNVSIQEPPKIPVARRVKWSKFQTEDRQLLDPTVKKKNGRLCDLAPGVYIHLLASLHVILLLRNVFVCMCSGGCSRFGKACGLCVCVCLPSFLWPKLTNDSSMFAFTCGGGTLSLTIFSSSSESRLPRIPIHKTCKFVFPRSLSVCLLTTRPPMKMCNTPYYKQLRFPFHPRHQRAGFKVWQFDGNWRLGFVVLERPVFWMHSVFVHGMWNCSRW